jgi:hypothetical protein
MERTKYHREYYRGHSERLAEKKAEERDRFDQCVSYWRQKVLFGREIAGLKAGCSEELIDRARVYYEKLLKEPVEEEVRMLR